MIIIKTIFSFVQTKKYFGFVLHVTGFTLAAKMFCNAFQLFCRHLFLVNGRDYRIVTLSGVNLQYWLFCYWIQSALLAKLKVFLFCLFLVLKFIRSDQIRIYHTTCVPKCSRSSICLCYSQRDRFYCILSKSFHRLNQHYE